MVFTAPAPLDTDIEAAIERNRTDYYPRITYEVAKEGRSPRPVRVYADGVFDIFHYGHANLLRQAKNLFPNVYLIAGLMSDEDVHTKKGVTVMTHAQRIESVRHCRYVDEVVPNGSWNITREFIEKHKIDFVAHDGIPYPVSAGEPDPYGYPKSQGMFVPTRRTEGISTTDLITKLLRNYDSYVERNLKRGQSASELNVSVMSEIKFRLVHQIRQWKINVGNFVEQHLHNHRSLKIKSKSVSQ